MRKIIFILVLIFGIMGSLSVFAHGVEEEARGKAISEKLEAKEVNCEDLTDDDFEALGEYFMGQMAGASHEAMNKMMEGMMGKEGEEEMHVIIGKRMSGCEPDSQLPQNMMNMMMRGGGMNQMMNFGYWSGSGWLSFALIILSLILLIIATIALIKWLIIQNKKKD